MCAVMMLGCPCMFHQLYPCRAWGPLPHVVWPGATQLPGCAFANGKEGGGLVDCCGFVSAL
jgi:hypothetical protein